MEEREVVREGEVEFHTLQRFRNSPEALDFARFGEQNSRVRNLLASSKPRPRGWRFWWRRRRGRFGGARPVSPRRAEHRVKISKVHREFSEFHRVKISQTHQRVCEKNLPAAGSRENFKTPPECEKIGGGGGGGGGEPPLGRA